MAAVDVAVEVAVEVAMDAAAVAVGQVVLPSVLRDRRAMAIAREHGR